MDTQSTHGRRNFVRLLAVSGFFALFGKQDKALSNELPARLRLIPAGPARDGRFVAGVHLALEPGWKTYWRYPGGSGIPPQFSWEGSKNVKSLSVLYPAPTRFHQGAGEFFGYMRDVVFPVEIIPENPDLPVELSLDLTYGLCERVCIPANSQAQMKLDHTHLTSADTALMGRFMARVPQRLASGSVVRDWTYSPASHTLEFTVDMVGGVDFVVVECPIEWGVAAAQEVKSTAQETHYTLTIEHLPPGLHNTVPLTVTIVGRRSAIEEIHTLDG